MGERGVQGEGREGHKYISKRNNFHPCPGALMAATDDRACWCVVASKARAGARWYGQLSRKAVEEKGIGSLQSTPSFDLGLPALPSIPLPLCTCAHLHPELFFSPQLPKSEAVRANPFELAGGDWCCCKVAELPQSMIGLFPS